jgi:hypothetical protein
MNEYNLKSLNKDELYHLIPLITSFIFLLERVRKDAYKEKDREWIDKIASYNSIVGDACQLYVCPIPTSFCKDIESERTIDINGCSNGQMYRCEICGIYYHENCGIKNYCPDVSICKKCELITKCKKCNKNLFSTTSDDEDILFTMLQQNICLSCFQ